MAVLIYGATGRTGSMVARALVETGIVVVLAGRDEARLKELGEALRCDYRVAALPELRAVLSGEIEVLVNVAGPFEFTVPLVARAAVEAGVHYVDLSNELAAVTALAELGPEFATRQRSAIPAAGFGTVATDLLAQLLTDAMPDIVGLELGMQIGGDGRSRGAAQSSSRVLAAGGARLVNGRLVHPRLGTAMLHHPRAAGLSFVPVALADLAVTPLTTGVQTVAIGAAVSMPTWLAPVVLPLAAMVGSLQAPKGRPATGEGTHISRAWAQGFRSDGTAEWATLTTGEGYEFSARAAAIIVSELLSGGAGVGMVTAVGQFGRRLRAELGTGIESSVGSSHGASKQ